MVRGLGRLPFHRGGSNAPGGASAEEVTGPVDPEDWDSALVGPPVLLPAAIFRQVLVDAADSTPVWARPRPNPEPAPELVTPVAESEPPMQPERRSAKGRLANPPRQSRRAKRR